MVMNGLMVGYRDVRFYLGIQAWFCILWILWSFFWLVVRNFWSCISNFGAWAYANQFMFLGREACEQLRISLGCKKNIKQLSLLVHLLWQLVALFSFDKTYRLLDVSFSYGFPFLFWVFSLMLTDFIVLLSHSYSVLFAGAAVLLYISDILTAWFIKICFILLSWCSCPMDVVVWSF